MKNDTNRQFSHKWSPAILEHGFTSLPNLLFTQRKTLGLSTSEFIVIGAIETFRWDNRNPYPSMEAISKRACLTPRRTRAIVSKLENKGYVIRIKRQQHTNCYSLEKLIFCLDQIATSSLPSGKKAPPSWEKTRLEQGLTLSSEKDPVKQDAIKNPIIKNRGISSTGEILSTKYRNPP